MFVLTGRSEVGADGVASGWVSDDPNTLNAKFGEMKWASTNFKAGDGIASLLFNLAVRVQRLDLPCVCVCSMRH